MRIQFHSHSCFSFFTADDTHIIVDPYLSGNPLADVAAKELDVDVVLLTHGHDDHMGDCRYFGKEGALIISAAEIIHYLSLKGFANLHAMQIGGGYQFDFGYVKMVPATHGSAIYENGTILGAGCPGGFILKLDGLTIYHAGDTGLSSEMEILGKQYDIDVALLPIGGNFTMDIPDALMAVDILKPKMVIPMHYNTFPVIKQDPTVFAQGCAQRGIDCRILNPGESLEI